MVFNKINIVVIELFKFKFIRINSDELEGTLMIIKYKYKLKYMDEFNMVVLDFDKEKNTRVRQYDK